MGVSGLLKKSIVAQKLYGTIGSTHAQNSFSQNRIVDQSPERAMLYQPRATPWVQNPTQLKALKGRSKTPLEPISYFFNSPVSPMSKIKSWTESPWSIFVPI